MIERTPTDRKQQQYDIRLKQLYDWWKDRNGINWHGLGYMVVALVCLLLAWVWPVYRGFAYLQSNCGVPDLLYPVSLVVSILLFLAAWMVLLEGTLEDLYIKLNCADKDTRDMVPVVVGIGLTCALYWLTKDPIAKTWRLTLKDPAVYLGGGSLLALVIGRQHFGVIFTKPRSDTGKLTKYFIDALRSVKSKSGVDKKTLRCIIGQLRRKLFLYGDDWLLTELFQNNRKIISDLIKCIGERAFRPTGEQADNVEMFLHDTFLYDEYLKRAFNVNGEDEALPEEFWDSLKHMRHPWEEVNK